MIGIYRVWNSKTGNNYIGSSENIENRIEQHKQNISNGIFNGCEMFSKDYKEYGKDSFCYEVLKVLKFQKELESWENYYIGKYDSLTNGYNKILSRRTPIVNVKHVKYELKPERLLTKFELAAQMKLSEKTLKEIIEDKSVPAIKIGNSTRYSLEDIINYYNSKKVEIE